MIWFTADTHFGHRGIINYCERPFLSVEEMDAELIRRWNMRVQQEDIIYHMGDFSFCGLTRTREILAQLNGEKILIRGNHDKHFFRKDGSLKDLRFARVWDSFTLIIAPRTEIVMSHYPYRGVHDLEGRDFSEQQIIDQGNYLIHGHVHRGWKQNGRMINVGVDVWNYAPVSEEEIITLLNTGEGTRGRDERLSRGGERNDAGILCRAGAR
jgi:calcineurin-like phosphoesterase family protein